MRKKRVLSSPFKRNYIHIYSLILLVVLTDFVMLYVLYLDTPLGPPPSLHPPPHPGSYGDGATDQAFQDSIVNCGDFSLLPFFVFSPLKGELKCLKIPELVTGNITCTRTNIYIHKYI